MKLSPIGSNQNVLTLNDGTEVLFSYDQPVAACGDGIGWIKTSKKWSKTTSKHINSWVNIYSVREVDQSVLNNLIK